MSSPEIRDAVPRTAVAILAGGRGKRLGGQVKSTLLVEGQRIIDRQLTVLGPLFDEIVIVANDPRPFGALGVDVIADRQGPGLGPLGGLDAALAWLPPGVEEVVCVAADMPFLAPPLLAWLRDAPSAAAVVPRPSYRPEALCARYHRSLAALVGIALARGTRAMHAFLEIVGAEHEICWLDDPVLRRLDPDLRTFTNINTPEDLIRS